MDEIGRGVLWAAIVLVVGGIAVVMIARQEIKAKRAKKAKGADEPDALTVAYLYGYEAGQKAATVLPDGSAFATASFPLPKDHWLYAPREYEGDNIDPKELPQPILTDSQRETARAAIQYAVRAATNCGKENAFDPDALVQNALYALCGPFTKVKRTDQPATAKESVTVQDERAAFEAWYIGQLGDSGASRLQDKSPNGAYCDVHTFNCFSAYSRGRADERAALAEGLAKVTKGTDHGQV